MSQARQRWQDGLWTQVAQVALGPWPIRPLFTGVLMTMIFQYGAADINATGRLQVESVFGAMPVSIARGAAIALPLWALLTLWRWRTHGRPLTRGAYLGIITIGGFCAGTTRYWLSDGSIAADPNLYALFLVRSTVLLMLVQTVVGLADARLRAQVRRADLALAQVERQQRMVLDAEERAKDLVSRFLHNRVQAGLVAVGMQLRQLEEEVSESAASRVASIRSALEVIRSDDVRQASRALSPDIRNIGLARALQELAQRFEPAMTVRIDVEGIERLPGITDEHLLACYRICEQALLNSAVHGDARLVRITARGADTGVDLEVRDDGTGLTSESPAPGAGLALVEAWVSRFAGTWALVQSPPRGTLLTASLPCTHSGDM